MPCGPSRWSAPWRMRGPPFRILRYQAQHAIVSHTILCTHGTSWTNFLTLILSPKCPRGCSMSTRSLCLVDSWPSVACASVDQEGCIFSQPGYALANGVLDMCSEYGRWAMSMHVCRVFRVTFSCNSIMADLPGFVYGGTTIISRVNGSRMPVWIANECFISNFFFCYIIL